MRWHYLSSRAVTRKVLSAKVCLTSVFGMGTGGPTPQSTPTYIRFGFTELLYCSTWIFICQEVFSQLLKLVTHTGFEPMLTA